MMSSEVERYISELATFRKERITSIRKAFLGAVHGVDETMKYRMPTYEKGTNWAAIGNQKHYVSVYFCSETIIDNIKKKYPKISTGKGCVRIKDNQEVPIKDLIVSFKKAMSYKKSA